MTTIRERADQLTAARIPFVQATVVRAQQPTSARAGDEAILLADGTIEGFVGGQCAENSVRKAALGVLQGGESVLLRVLPDGDLHFPEAPGASVVVNPCLSSGALEIYLAPRLPAPLVRICGATPIAEALVRFCEMLGYQVARDDADGWNHTSAVVIASHGGVEADIIRAALEAGVGYIGLVASTIRGAAILDGLALSPAERARMHTPVGLPIGAQTPAEIAVSIAAELVTTLRDQPAAPADAVSGSTVVDAVDPVCGMTVPITPAAEHAEVDGQDYWFCSAGCRKSFTEQRVSR